MSFHGSLPSEVKSEYARDLAMLVILIRPLSAPAFRRAWEKSQYPDSDETEKWGLFEYVLKRR